MEGVHLQGDQRDLFIMLVEAFVKQKESFVIMDYIQQQSLGVVNVRHKKLGNKDVRQSDLDVFRSAGLITSSFKSFDITNRGMIYYEHLKNLIESGKTTMSFDEIMVNILRSIRKLSNDDVDIQVGYSSVSKDVNIPERDLEGYLDILEQRGLVSILRSHGEFDVSLTSLGRMSLLHPELNIPQNSTIRRRQAVQQQADVLLITVTEEETEAVFEALHDQTGHQPEPHYQGDKTYYDLGVLGGAQVRLVRSEMGAVTPGGAFSTVFTAIQAMRPAAILMVGIAFGVNPTTQQIGDVLVARQLQSYEPQRLSTVEGMLRLIPRGDRVTASVRTLDRCRDAARTWKTAQVKFGLMLSGDKLLDHQSAVESLLAQEPEAIGGEMEGAGLYVAATQHQIDWLLIKAICDWADGNKTQDKAARQALAASNAAQFTMHLLAKGGFAPETWEE